uniref:Uncharacterized protein n=1 Tax=Anguilla anguilla TaxID=7936 RepID=A0A0E9V165_ANGAN
MLMNAQTPSVASMLFASTPTAATTVCVNLAFT